MKKTKLNKTQTAHCIWNEWKRNVHRWTWSFRKCCRILSNSEWISIWTQRFIFPLTFLFVFSFVSSMILIWILWNGFVLLLTLGDLFGVANWKRMKWERKGKMQQTKHGIHWIYFCYDGDYDAMYWPGQTCQPKTNKRTNICVTHVFLKTSIRGNNNKNATEHSNMKKKNTKQRKETCRPFYVARDFTRSAV